MIEMRWSNSIHDVDVDVEFLIRLQLVFNCKSLESMLYITYTMTARPESKATRCTERKQHLKCAPEFRQPPLFTY